MEVFIRMEYLVANLLVELMEQKKINKVSFETVKEYGFKVEKVLKDNNVSAILLYSSEYTKRFLHDFSSFFKADGDFICIKDNITTEMIRDEILSFVPIEILFAMLNNNAISNLL